MTAQPTILSGHSASSQESCTSRMHNFEFGLQLPGSELIGCRDFGQIRGKTDSGYHASLRVASGNEVGYLIEEGLAFEPDIPVRFVQVPGLTECVSRDLVRGRGDSLANYFKPSAIISLGSNAIGLKRTKDHHTREQFVEERFETLVKTTPEGQKLIVIACSMGGVVASDLLEMNLEAGEPLKIGGVVYIAPAVRKNGGLKKTFVFKFGKQIVFDGARDIVTSGPVQLMKDVGVLATLGRDTFRDARNATHHAKNILGSTSKEQIAAIVSRYPTLVLAGSKDEAVDFDLWYEMKSSYPHMIRFNPLRGRGHEMILHSLELADKLSREIRAANILE